MRKTLTTAALTAGLCAATVMGSTPAMAADLDPNLTYFNANVDVNSFVELAKAAPLCATTFTSNLAKARPGVPVVVSTFPVLTVDFQPTTRYVATVQGVTIAFVNCTLT